MEMSKEDFSDWYQFLCCNISYTIFFTILSYNYSVESFLIPLVKNFIQNLFKYQFIGEWVDFWIKYS